ncbi:hypothetical protein IVB56_16805 [Bradyrhizobium sp. CW7]|uniref:hypothetical protein n=1 Tax=Bradyrhizobium sp. CW7 TaxID=2782688 RepID=UPI001FFB8443|nr:hypothetical protein [Bradyrhizobium sp. CW7]MCK1352703.1 hypothetical protein [Bradyrhizobium sp. CW7]
MWTSLRSRTDAGERNWHSLDGLGPATICHRRQSFTVFTSALASDHDGKADVPSHFTVAIAKIAGGILGATPDKSGLYHTSRRHSWHAAQRPGQITKPKA